MAVFSHREPELPSDAGSVVRGRRVAPPARRVWHFRPWPWTAAGLALFLAVSPPLVWEISLAEIGGQRGALVACWLVLAAAAAALIQRPWRLPAVPSLRRCAGVLGGTYLVALLGSSLAGAGEFAAFLGLALVFQAAWILAGRELGILPGFVRLGVVPTGRSLAVLALNARFVEWVDTADAETLRRAQGILLDPDAPLEPRWVRALTGELRHLRLHLADRILEREIGRVPLDHLPADATPLFRSDPLFDRLHRALDVLVVVATLPLTIPTFLTTALWLQLESSSPVLYSQPRVGRNGRRFRLVKFRSMRPDAGARAPSLLDDSRVTRLGRFLRETHLDELPQLWNVLKGDMSIVGPRPEQVPLAEKFNAELRPYGYRHVIRPGITGWAQIHQSYAESVQLTRVKLEYDLYYVKHRSMLLDLVILGRTIPKLMRDARGLRNGSGGG